MDRVVQEDITGCGLAGVAMLACLEYAQVKAVALEVLGLELCDDLYTSASQLSKLGKKFDLDIGGRRRVFKDFQSLPELAILAINYFEQHDTWHWVVFCRTESESFVLDPKKSVKSERRLDFSRLAKNTKWFMSVKRIQQDI